MQQPSLTKLTLKKLRGHLLDKRFAIPKLQRNFVWDPGRAAKLLDSIYRNMPIGSLFIWETDRKSANLIRQSTNVLPAYASRTRNVWFVIDGQQRLSVIHQAFAAQQRTNDAGREIDFGRLCFVVSPSKEEDDPPRIVYRKPIDGQLVPLNEILSADYARLVKGRSKAFSKAIKLCRARFLNYPLPVVIVRSSTLDEIGELFIRINSQGMRITSADRAIALMGKLDVRAMAEELRQRVRDSVFALGGIDPILMGFNLIEEQQDQEGDPPKLKTLAMRWSKRLEEDETARDVFRKKWDKYQKAFLSAVDLLHNRFPVYDETFLPSANMIATLAVFYFHNHGQPTKAHLQEINKWFWATGVGQRYSGRGYHRNIVADAKFFAHMAQGKRQRFTMKDRIEPHEIQATEYSSRSSAARAFFCLLALQKPRYLDNGEQIFLSTALSHANKKHRHHIFPRAQLARHLPAKHYNSLCNICYLVAEDNQGIGMRLPHKYMSDYREANAGRFKSAMRSHLIPFSDASGLWDRGVIASFKKFRRERLKVVCRAFEQAAGMRLFRTA